MTEKCILYLSGGVMSGVFGAGILTSLQEKDAYGRIACIYSGSAGAINGAYFLARQSPLGSTIYFEDLTKGFIHPTEIFTGTLQRFWSRYISQISPKKMHNPVDIDYLFDVIINKKPLDTKALQQQPIPLYVKLLDMKKCEIEYKDARRDTLGTLKSSVSAVPYYFPSCNHESIDGDCADPLGLDILLKHHQDEKIIIAFNYTPNLGLRYTVKNTLEGMVASAIYDSRISRLFRAKNNRLIRDIKNAGKNNRILLIYPPKESPTKPSTTNPKKLKTTYEMGKRAANKILEFIE